MIIRKTKPDASVPRYIFLYESFSNSAQKVSDCSESLAWPKFVSQMRINNVQRLKTESA